MIRTKFAVPILILVASVLALGFFAGTLIEKAIEGPASSQYGAKIDVNSVDVSYFPLSVQIKGLAVTDLNDPMKNAVSIGHIQFSMAFLPLIEKKVLIPDLALENLQFDTVRVKSGAFQNEKKVDTTGSDKPGLVSKASKKVMSTEVAQKTKQKAKEKLASAKVDALSFQTPDMKSPIQLKTRQEAQALNQEMKVLQDKWQTRLKQNPVKSDYEKLKKEWSAFETQYPAKIDSVETFNQQLNKINSLKKQSDQVVDTLSAEKKAFDQDYRYMNDKINRLSQLAEQDYQNAVKNLKADTYSFDNITEMYLSAIVNQKVDPLMERFRQLQDTYKRFRGSKPPKVQARWRHPGQMIHFPKEKSLPTLWIQRVVLSASSNSKKSVEGQIFNISSNHASVGEPTKGSIQGQNLSGPNHQLDLDFLFEDGSMGPSNVEFSSVITGIKVPRTTIVDKGSEKIYLDRGDIVITTQGGFKEGALNVKSIIDARKLRFKQRGIAMDAFTINRLIFMSLVQMPRIKVQMQVTGTLDSWDIAMSSNLDKFDVGGIMTDQLAQKKRQLSQQLNADVKAQQEALMSTFSSQKDGLTKQISVYQDQANDLQNQLDERVDAEKKKLQDKQDALQKEAQAKIDAEQAKLDAEKERLKKEAEEKAKKEAQKALRGLGF